MLNPRRWWRRLVLRVGRRGASLLFLSLLDLLYGLSLFKPPSEAKLSPTVAFIRHVAPLPAWAGLWTAVGVICLVGAFRLRDRWAFTAAMGLKTLWGTTFLVGWLVADLDRGWVSAAIWLPMAAWVSILASWPEPKDAFLAFALKEL